MAGRRGHQGPLPGLGWSSGRGAARPLPTKRRGSSRGRLTVGDRDRRGKDALAGLRTKTFRRRAQLCGEDHPSHGPKSRLSQAIPDPCPHAQPLRPRLAGAGGGHGAVASQGRALQPRVPARGPAPGGGRAGAGRAGAGPRSVSLVPLAAAEDAESRAEPGRALNTGSSSSLSPPPLPPSLPPSPFQNTQCRNVPKMTSERSRIPCLSAAAAEGTGKKQQEGRAMATLDRKVPSPEAFLGKPWSSWIDAAKLHCSDSKNPTASSSFYYPVTFPFT